MKPIMSMKHYATASFTALLFAALSLMLSGCGVSAITQQFTGVRDPLATCLHNTLPKPKGDLVVAVAVHQGAPAPAVPAEIAPMITATLASGHTVDVVPIDGNPAKAAVPTEPIATDSCDAFNTDLRNASNAVSTTITSAHAKKNGDNLYQAISVSAEAAGKGGHVVIVDSGLADSGPLNFTKTGMTTTNPRAAAKFAAIRQPLTSAKGVSFTLLLGYTASPQQALSGTERSNVAQIWANTLEALGASKVTLVAAPRPGTGPKTRFTTIPSPVAKSVPFTPPVSTPTTTVFHENQIHFQPDSTALVAPKAAAKALRGITRWLAAKQGNRAVITGTTASAGTEGGRLRLSRERAQTIRRLILSSNAAIKSEQLTVKGVGTHFPGYVSDRRPDGSLDPVTAAENRTVRITALPHA